MIDLGERSHSLAPFCSLRDAILSAIEVFAPCSDRPIRLLGSTVRSFAQGFHHFWLPPPGWRDQTTWKILSTGEVTPATEVSDYRPNGLSYR
jgi:hypothetical protein